MRTSWLALLCSELVHFLPASNRVAHLGIRRTRGWPSSDHVLRPRCTDQDEGRGAVGRRRRRGRQALDAHPDRDQEPQRERRSHAGLRRAEGASRRGGDRLARTTVQTCVVHLLRNSFRYAVRHDWDKIAKLLKPVYTAATEEAALERFADSPTRGARSIRRSSGSGRTPGRSSLRSSGSTPRSAASSARRTPSSR